MPWHRKKKLIHICHKCGKGFSYPSKLKAHFSRKTSCTTGNFPVVLSSAGNLSELPSTKLPTPSNYEKNEMVPIRLSLA